MLSVIVIDDEPIICELIRRLADWDRLGLELLGFENNGINAYHAILEKKPDIVITDIRIPGIDGLDLIQRVQKAGAGTRFIVISGYRQFEYAHSALQYGVTDYLLKPINKGELNQALEKLTMSIRREREGIREMEDMRQELSTQSSHLRIQFIREMIEGRIPDGTLPVEEINARYKYAFRDAPCGIFILKAGCSREEDRSLVPILFTRVIPLVRELFADADVYESMEEGTRLYCLYQLAGSSPVRNRQKELMDRVHEALSMFDGLVLTLAPSPEAGTPSCLPSCMQRAEHSVHLRLMAKHAGIVHYEESYSWRLLTLDDVFPANERRRFSEIVENGVSEEVVSQIRAIFKPLEENGTYWKYDPEILYSLCRAVLQTLSAIPSCMREVTDAFRGVMEVVDDADTVHDVISGFRKKLMLELAPYFRSVAERSQMPVQLAKNYIRDHFSQPIDLDTVAMHANISPNYLSSLFKKENGMSFSEYLTHVRINEAKRLLRTTQMSVAEVAERAGYSDAKYFTKVFSKECGISPKKYQKL